MDKKTVELISKTDSQRLEAIIMEPENPKGILQISHGMCEHKERYLPFMEYMTKKGYVCIIHDHRGHGKSVSSQQDLGYFNNHGGENLVEDLHLVIEKVKNMYPNLPLVLLGHSMGALVSRCYMKKYDTELVGLVICGCPSKRKLLHTGRILSKLMQLVKGAHGKSSFMNQLVLGGYEKAFKSEGANAWVCSDKEVVRNYSADPLCNFKFTLNGYETLIWLTNYAYSKKGWELKNSKLSIHVVSGEEDPCMISRQSFVEGVKLLETMGYKKVTSFLYEGMRHELLNEIGKERVYKDVADFCDTAMNR